MIEDLLKWWQQIKNHPVTRNFSPIIGVVIVLAIASYFNVKKDDIIKYSIPIR